ncbi:unnamed protein product [Oikopleura dioica]|uniref:Uncharacterized protein n=1 Tax=Oikopleura dioica TaxID=34765 RepID=E4Z4J0_OIKDI|nr:unnamed protein product [Oikopleura dioica]
MKRACAARHEKIVDQGEISEIILAFTIDGAVELNHFDLEERLLLAPLLELLIEARRSARIWADREWNAVTSSGILNVREIMGKTPFNPDATNPEGNTQLEYLFGLVAVAKLGRALCENSWQHRDLRSQAKWLLRKITTGDYSLELPKSEAALKAAENATEKLRVIWKD